MFCEQCEQTASGQGCHQWGACGKSPEVNAVQDLLVYCLRGLAVVAIAARDHNIDTTDADILLGDALFSTMTNVNFDRKRFITLIRQVITLRELLKLQVQNQNGRKTLWPDICSYEPDWSESLVEQGLAKSLERLQKIGQNPDIFALQLTVLYGVKGLASYAFLASELGQHDPAVYHFCEEALIALDRTDLDLMAWVNLALKVGEVNFRAMELLDAGHTQTYGHPVPTPVPLNPRQGQAILVSGHDIKILAALLEQTQDTGLTVYTHGELLPAHGYPKLKEKYAHFYGHYGTAWQNQTKDFAKFPGAIVVTTNCLMPPHETYDDKLFSVGSVGYPGLIHLGMSDGVPDFSPAIAKSLAMPGFTVNDPPRSVVTGYARNAVLSVADTVVAAVKAGQIRHFFLVGGCDGAKPDRNYYTEFVEKVPDDCVVLTLACGKFRFFDQQLGRIGDLPRLLDVGQCNDAYSAIQIALGLAQAFEMEVNDLPLSMILSWYEQKAIAVLLTLLHLGIKDIRLGPTLPAFLTPNVFALLSERYNLQGITTPDADLAACLG
ncbi:hydroxylamine reductase [Spirulina major CS-329]|uniref:hydroxylamine reductase n=1 Tax=Spirulina TaxID=1154 RepID=UPI00233118F5|nr:MULTISPECIES: hydroxylamine reductase [Spirulina]MDB9496185.1 hydroxylamine reductase [Spirulina subsalsa CS-330]MDB9501617.1 hydroxylamine reductase [Spirulina major CS-329]